MFVDETNIEIQAGTGGDGCLAYRREKYIPMGGPFGGTGGKGGDVIFISDSGLKTLIDLKYQKHIKGQNGQNGMGKNKNGFNAKDTIIKVPIGTTIKDNDTGMIIGDLTSDKEEVIIAYGGRGGRGNVSLATKTNPCPSFCEKGEPGEIRHINTTLRMMADVGLVGMPSVGKSTILSNVSAANPKIASYHFTTLSPNLGLVTTKNMKKFVLADLPGLIEGASDGAGLGIRFLKHVERTKILVHVLDMSGSEGRNPLNDYNMIKKELIEYNPKLLDKPKVIVANKMDIEKSKENLIKFKKEIKDIPIFEIEAINGTGLTDLMNYLGNLVEETDNEPLFAPETIETHVLYKFKKEKPWIITQDNNVWVVRSEKIERIFKMTNFNTEEAYVNFAKKIRRTGLDDELIKLGIKDGDIVRILDFEFEWTK